MTTLFDFILQGYSQRRVTILFVGILVCGFLFGVTGYFIGVGTLLGDTGEKVNILDLLFNYSEEQAYAQLSAYGEIGRQVCLASTLILDTIFPLVFGSFFALLLAHLFQHTRYKWVVLLPIIVVVLDYVENTHIALMLINFPERMPLIAYTGSIFTNAKWITMALIGLVISMGFFIRNRKNYIPE